MKKRLRLLAWMLTLTMLCELLPFSAFAQSDVGQQLALAAAQSLEEENGEATIIGKCGDNLQWSLSSDGVLTIDGTGRMYYFSLSSAPWSNYSDNIKTVIVNYGTTYIGSYAFYGCSSLTSVSIPDSVTSIGEQAFNGCSSLASISIPKYVTSIDYGTFAYCTSLTSINIPESVTSIGDYAFEWCSVLTSISIPDSVTSIGTYAFYGCPLSDVYYSGTQEEWNSISISSGNDSLLNAAVHFQNSGNGNGSISSGICGDNLTWTLTSDGVLTIDGTGKMFDYNSVPPYNISPWYHNTNITTLIVKDGVTSIGDYAFLGCYKISNISFPNSLTSIGYSAFSPCSGLTEITLPENLIYLGGYSLASGNFSSILIPIGITSIEPYTFSNCKKLKSISLPDTLTSIGEGTFNQCTSLDSFNIPKNVVDIGRYAFWNCTSLKHIEIPSGIPQINEGTFDNCSSLKSISIPSSVVSIGESAFYGCNSLEDVYFSGTQSQWETISVANYQNTALENATIHYQSTGTEDEKEFTFGRDNLSFLNAADYYFQGDELEYWKYKVNHPVLSSFTDIFKKHPSQYASLHLSTEKFNQLTKNLSPTALSWFKNHVYSGDAWDGSCFGMVLVAGIHYIAPNNLPFAELHSAELNNNSANYSLPAPVDNSEVEDLINYYLASQYLPTHYKVLANCLYNCSHDYDSVLKEITAALSQHIPVFARFNGHEILLLNVKEDTNDHYVLGIYDPNYSDEQTLILYKSPYIDESGDGYLNTEYKGQANYIISYTLASDLDLVDVRNYFDPNIDHETSTDYNDAHITVDVNSNTAVVYGGQYYYRSQNGKLIEKNPDVKVLYTLCSDADSSSTVELVFPKPSSSEDFRVELYSDEVNNASLLLNDTLLSISTSGPVELTYNEADRTVDVTAEDPTDVNLLMTKNDVNESWPWHSWALDTTGTTTLHADLDDDGLHLSGDGITNAKYATENADTENVDSGTISVQPDADGITTVTITNKKSSSGDTLEIVTPSAPTTGNAITITNGFAYIDDPEQPVNSAALGDVVTIVANDRSSESKTFTGWVVNSGDVTLDDSSASPTSFTMGDKAVSITAQYSTNSTPTPTPGGGGSSSGGGGGGGAAVLIGVGAAAAITAGVIMMSPVEIKGRVVLADQAAVPGAKISLLREGKVVAQTTADENGSFSLKAKRGSYELTAAYTNADGQFIYKTIDIKAPAKDLTVTF